MKPATDQLPADEQASDPDYWRLAREPLASLCFLLPLLITYELGVAWVGDQQGQIVRNGADCWMRSALVQLGMDHPLLLPGLVVSVLIIWHVCGKYRWRISTGTLLGMFAESLLYAFLLLFVGRLQGVAFDRLEPVNRPAIEQQRSDGLHERFENRFSNRSRADSHLSIPFARNPPSTNMDARLESDAGSPPESAEEFHRASRGNNVEPGVRAIMFLGAGFYEEVLFRLCLLPACFGFFRLVRLRKGWASVLAVLSSSLIFSFAHYVGGDTYGFTLYGFTFRALAGMIFAGLFVLRGFGITVGCHAAYDLLVGLALRTA